MDSKQLLFWFRMHWNNIKNFLNFISESCILLASLSSLYVIIHKIGFSEELDFIQSTPNLLSYILLSFFIGISIRYIINFKEIINEKMLYLDIAIYFFLFSVLSTSLFFREAVNESLPYLTVISEPIPIYILILLLSIIHLARQAFSLIQSRIKPGLLFLFSLVFFILVGAGLLMLPNATVGDIRFIDALFTSATSVCITGLTTVDVATTFTQTGHIIIIILAQIGGIGVMTFTSFIALSFMANTSFGSKLMLKDMLNEERTGGLFRVILNIVFVTFLIEGIGAYLIFLEIHGSMPGGIKEDVFYAIFHSISAFCSAGLSTLSGSMSNPLVVNKYLLHVWASVLIILGGLGFPIVFNYMKLIKHYIRNIIGTAVGWQKQFEHRPRIINIHTQIVVKSTAVILLLSFILYFILEYNNTLADLPWEGKIADAFLGAVTPRTGGIYVSDTTTLAPATLVLTLILMIIGAAPMSTGGGLKVTTVFITLLATYSFLREKTTLDVYKRKIPTNNINRALAILVIYFSWLGIAFFILSFTDKELPLFGLLFEAVSALSTVGLSMNLTPLLSTSGKIIIIITMLIGRVGLFTFFASFWKASKKNKYSHPEENVLLQ